MNSIDWLIIILVAVSLFRGYRIGLVRQAGSTIGFIAGLFVGSLIANPVIAHLHDSLDKSLASLVIVLGCSFLLMTIGEILGIRLKRRFINHSIDNLDEGLGSVMGMITLLAGVWLIGAILVLAPPGGLQQNIKNSRILAVLNQHLPPATKVLSSLNKLIDPNGFPEVFTGLEPSPQKHVPVPSLGSFNEVVAAAEPSVVKLEGGGCGGIVEGSGFVFAKGQIVTNAHVVAGVAHPKVIDQNGIHDATVTWFDPDLDLAVLRASNLAGKPLKITTADLPAGTSGVVLGYPAGGAFNAQAASILDQFIAVGRNIYGQGQTTREVYSLQAHVIPGNSGGPLVGSDGTVLGIVFATSTTYNDVGYALTGQQIASELAQAQQSTTAHSTSTCSE
jgi:S1-C subfamily serine protease